MKVYTPEDGAQFQAIIQEKGFPGFLAIYGNLSGVAQNIEYLAREGAVIEALKPSDLSVVNELIQEIWQAFPQHAAQYDAHMEEMRLLRDEIDATRTT